MKNDLIRNFCIIAHIDHGKSTLADRILEYTNSVSKREMKEQLLDSMDLERERGITIKLNAVQIKYLHTDGKNYILNLIDTPGHVDFTYEVSRSLAACEGAILVVDAVQGVEAQTLANVYQALDNDLFIIPVINKIDLPSADIPRVKQEIEEIIGLDASEAILISAKEGININQVLDAIIDKVPAPTSQDNSQLQALVFDSVYDSFRGVIPLVRVFKGSITKGDKIKLMSTNAEFEVLEVGVHTPKELVKDTLNFGDVGYVVASIRDISVVNVGDTITNATNGALTPLPGYRKLKSMVFCGLYPIDSTQYEDLKDALDKLRLNDSSLVFENESSQALGFGFRTGFLGLLHMEIIMERIRREFKIDLIATAPSVVYKVFLTDRKIVFIDNPSRLPDAQVIDYIEEPFVKITVFTPNEYVGVVMDICQKKRGTFKNMQYGEQHLVVITYNVPLSEMVYDFFDKIKSSTKGYASFDYELSDYQRSDLAKMEILLNGDVVDALSLIVHKSNAYYRGRAIVEKLRGLIPRALFEIPIQAAIGSKIIARESIKALRKDVISKCYGGDITRKKKLLEKQKEGKKKMKQIGSVEIPQEAFMAILSTSTEDEQ
ncbi:MAG: translation elongation factor 4 [Acholeplasmatales bacterium]|jgi:GTP-binding protein LepA|nr:translation elongation factor 4 [Acholeplasmatales bacterium]